MLFSRYKVAYERSRNIMRNVASVAQLKRSKRGQTIVCRACPAFPSQKKVAIHSSRTLARFFVRLPPLEQFAVPALQDGPADNHSTRTRAPEPTSMAGGFRRRDADGCDRGGRTPLSFAQDSSRSDLGTGKTLAHFAQRQPFRLAMERRLQS